MTLEDEMKQRGPNAKKKKEMKIRKKERNQERKEEEEEKEEKEEEAELNTKLSRWKVFARWKKKDKYSKPRHLLIVQIWN